MDDAQRAMMGVKIVWRAAKSRRKKRGTERDKLSEGNSSKETLFGASPRSIYEQKKTRRNYWQIYEATGWYRNNVAQKRENENWNTTRKGKKGDCLALRGYEGGNKKRGYLIGWKQRGRRAQKRREKQKMEKLFHTSCYHDTLPSLWPISPLWDDWGWRYVTVCTKLSSLSFFLSLHHPECSCLSVSSLLDCKQKVLFCTGATGHCTWISET